MKKLTALLVLCSFVLMGCAALDNPDTAQKLVIADRSFTGVMTTARRLHHQGVLDDDDILEINPYVQKGNKALDAAWEAYSNGQDVTAEQKIVEITKFAEKIRDLIQEGQQNE